MSGPDELAQRRNVRLFVGAHLVAVSAIFGLAVLVGGGVAPTPFPPNIRLAAASPRALAETPAPAVERSPHRPTGEAAPPMPVRFDVAAPWVADVDGRVQLRDR